MAAFRETEIKLPVAHRGEIRRRLKALGFRVVEARRFESNRLFDFPDQRLRNTRRVLRLRLVDRDCLLTFKGPPLKSQRH
ncbi:MAG: CYTH domain-containing protein, partial [Deltaproteobacteria bacterium]